MQTISYSDARKSLKAVLDRVVDDADTTIITVETQKTQSSCP